MENLVVTLNDVVISFKGKDILEIQALNLYQTDRIGIIGSNGAGKTTLLKLLKGELVPEVGRVQRQIEFEMFQQVEAGSDGFLPDYSLASRLRVPDRQVQQLSGGEETRLKLARALGSYQGGLLLDEPTTHLDEEGIEELIQELTYYYGALVTVSHDRYFLNQIVTKIWEIADGKVTEYRGNYDAYLAQKELAHLSLENEQIRFRKEQERLLTSVAKKKQQVARLEKVSGKQKKRNIKPNRLSSTRQKDTVVKQGQKTVKALENRLNQLGDEPQLKREQALRFPIAPGLEIHNPIPIRGSDFTLVRGEKILLKKVDFQFHRGEVIALKGSNGCGKSSFLAEIVKGHDHIVTSPKVVFNVFAQRDYRFAAKLKVMEYVLRESQYTEALCRSVLHRLNFTGADLVKELTDLSGGERVRLALGLVFLQPSNVLVLDEPSNFLDLQSIEALETFIQAYEGTILLVSHDQHFIEKVATSIYYFNNQQFIQTL